MKQKQLLVLLIALLLISTFKLQAAEQKTVTPSPALTEYLQQAWELHPEIQAAQTAVLVAKARHNAADRPVYNPEIEVELERTDINTFSFGVSQAIDWGNKRAAATEIADAEIRLFEAELMQLRFSLSDEVLNVLVDLQAARNLQKLAQQRVELMQEFLANTEKRQQAGDVGTQDVALAKVALSEAKMQLAGSKAQQAENLAKLQAASGIFSDNWPSLLQEPPKPDALQALETYFEKLPPLIAANARLIVAKSNIALAKAERKADPTLGIRAGAEDTEALLGLTFSMPLNFRNTYRAEVEVASQESLQIEQLLMAERQRAKAHLLGAHRRYSLVYTAWQSWKLTGMTSLQQQMDLIQTIWKAGEMSTADYLVQAKQNVDAQETAVELSSQMWMAWIEWLTVSGKLENWILQAKF